MLKISLHWLLSWTWYYFIVTKILFWVEIQFFKNISNMQLVEYACVEPIDRYKSTKLMENVKK